MNLSGDWPYIENVAADRYRNHRHRKHHVSRFGRSIEIAGAAGELAARRYLGLPENLHTDLDGGVDLIWRGQKVDVKTTKLHGRTREMFLQWPKGKPVKCDLVLVVGLDRHTKDAVVMGYTEAKNIKHAPINESRPIPCHEYPFTQLTPAWEIWS